VVRRALQEQDWLLLMKCASLLTDNPDIDLLPDLCSAIRMRHAKWMDFDHMISAIGDAVGLQTWSGQHARSVLSAMLWVALTHFESDPNSNYAQDAVLIMVDVGRAGVAREHAIACISCALLLSNVPAVTRWASEGLDQLEAMG
jgi:hypothetical protein